MELRKSISTMIFLRNQPSDDDAACCKRPPCWACLLIFIGVVIAAVLIAILVTITSARTNDLTTTTEPSASRLTTTTTDPTGTPPVNPDTTRSTGTSPVIPKTTSTAKTTTTTTPMPSPMNCQDVYNEGGTTSGVYTIYKDRNTQVQVYCEQTIEGGGWLVFQRRTDGSVNFYRGWSDYKHGFGNPADEYWLGNDHIYMLTEGRGQKLKVVLNYDSPMVANYAAFWIGSENEKYLLYVSGYSGTHTDGDALSLNHEQFFSTKDRDNDDTDYRHCAQYLSGAWWYKYCNSDKANLNGVYGDKYFQWINRYRETLTGSTMMMKPK